MSKTLDLPPKEEQIGTCLGIRQDWKSCVGEVLLELNSSCSPWQPHVERGGAGILSHLGCQEAQCSRAISSTHLAACCSTFLRCKGQDSDLDC